MIPHSASDFSVEDERKASVKETAWVKWQDKSISGLTKKFSKEEWSALHADPRFLKDQEEWLAKLLEDQKKFTALMRQSRPSAPRYLPIIFR